LVSVTYHSNFGTDQTKTTDVVSVNSKVTVLNYADTQLPVQEGYAFNGWSTTLDGTGTTFAAGASARVDNNGENHLYAKWIHPKFKVTYSYEGVVPVGAPSVPQQQEYYFFENVTVAQKPTLTGYTFYGWYKDGQRVTSFSMPFSNVVLKGSWRKNGNIEVRLAAKTVTYNGSEQSLDAIITGGPAGVTLTLTDFNASLAGGKGKDVRAEGYLGTVNGNPQYTDPATGDVYDITYIPGTLVINRREVTLTSGTDTKPYDGTALTKDGVTVGADGFALGEGATYDVTGSQTLAGSSSNAFTYALDEGTKTGNYRITQNYGTLTVTRNENLIVITANSKSWVYDSAAHSDGGYAVTYGGAEVAATDGKYILPTGDEVTASVVGSVTNVADMVPGNNVVSGYAVENASNYASIMTVDGTLKITKQAILITATDKTYWYNASVQGPQGATFTTAFNDHATWTTLEGTDTLTSLDVAGGKKNAGTYTDELVPSAAILMNGTENVTGNYELTYETGDLEIKKRGSEDDPNGPVTIAATDKTYLYNALVQGPQGATFTSAIDDHATWTTLEGTDALTSLKVAGGQMAVGTYANELVPSTALVMNGQEDVTDNYELTYREGDLKIDVRYFTVKFVDWNNGELKTEQVAYGRDATAPNDPERSGYGFTSWDKAYTNVMSDLTVRAQYTENQVTSTYTAGTGGSVDPATETIGAATGAASGSTATAEPGYTFTNWTNANGDVVSDDPNFIPPKVDGLNVGGSYTANFTENPVTINYQAGTGGSVDPATETIGAATGAASGSTATAEPGYTFTNWTNANGEVVSNDPSFTPDKVGDLNVSGVYTANFEAIVYTLSYAFVAPDGTPITLPSGEAPPVDQTYTVVNPATVVTLPAPTGWNITGWYEA
jgi:uncharacterized repeat protein (TIGR02543 family)